MFNFYCESTCKNVTEKCISYYTGSTLIVWFRMSLCRNMSHTPIYDHQFHHVIIKCLIFTVNQHAKM